MTLRELLVEKQAALIGRWLNAVLAEYGERTAVRWLRTRDPFANPVGHALTTGLPDLFAMVVGDGDPSAEAQAALETILRIRSVQELSPSQAVGFVYHLRDAVREELAAELAGGGAHAADLAAVEKRIERLAMLAFDQYVRIRDQIFRLRQDELRRSVASLLRRWNAELPDPNSEPASEGVPLHLPTSPGTPR
jgi:hypothetical protein